MNGIIGFLILIVLLNVLSRILKAAGRAQTPPAPRPRVPADGPPSREEAPPEPEAPRTLESWLKEMLGERAEEGAQPAPAGELESAAPENASDGMRRYIDFERHVESEIERTERLARERRAARAEQAFAPVVPPPGAVAPELPRAADPVFALLRDGVSLRAAFVVAEILGPCRARIAQRNRAPRAVRSVLG